MTPAQREAWNAYRDCGSYAKAADLLGKDESTIRRQVEKAKAWEEQPEGIKAAAEHAGLGAGTITGGWRIIQHEDGSRDSVRYTVDRDTVADIAGQVREAFDGMKAVKAIKPPKHTLGELLTVYPVMDLHYGMQAWGRETGSADYSLKEADADAEYAFEKVLALTPASREAVLILGGDTFHADDNRAETPQSKHKLDVDTRHWKVLDQGVQLVSYMIERLLACHGKLTVRVLRGNHDEHSHLILTFALAERYRKNKRVTIEKNPRDLFMKQWGRAAIFAHHGDKAKPQQLSLYLSDVCPFWSDTRHRYALTGHVHHDAAKDVGPLRWESLRAFCPPDAYAASMGYGARRALQSLTFDKQDGLVLRAIDPIERAA